MCGIFALLNHSNVDESVDIVYEFMKGQSRGPEFSKLENKYIKMLLGFHRLAINGLNPESNQPLVVDNVVLICNGEIYNYKELYASMGITPQTQSDCEVIIHLFIRYGIAQTLVMLDGVFSFVLFDNRVSNDLNSQLYVARDPLGVRPLYYLKNKRDNNWRMNSNVYGFASELKCLQEIHSSNLQDYTIEQFNQAHIACLICQIR